MFAADKLTVRDRGRLYSLLEEAIEEHAGGRGAATVEPERKLIFELHMKLTKAHNKLLFRNEDITQPFVTHDPDLLELVAPQLEAELTQQLADKSLKEQVKRILKKFLAGQRPRLEDVALELRVSTRTLQRRLLAERITFHRLVEEARREMAQHYLVQSSLELNETAYLLGYEDPNSFIRAFHKWEGTSPGEWRSTRCPCTP
jgi:AraC-like DNA-binding protein